MNETSPSLQTDSQVRRDTYRVTVDSQARQINQLTQVHENTVEAIHSGKKVDFSSVRSFLQTTDLAPEDKRTAVEAVDLLESKHRHIANLWNNLSNVQTERESANLLPHSTKEEKVGSILYSAATDSVPQDKILARPGVVSMRLDVFGKEDYNKLHTSEGGNGAANERTGGFYVEELTIRGRPNKNGERASLTLPIAVINRTSATSKIEESTIRHEEDHAINNIIDSVISGETEVKWNTEAIRLQKAKLEKWYGLSEKKIPILSNIAERMVSKNENHLRRSVLDYSLKQAKDEAISYLNQTSDFEEMKQILRGDIYDFFNQFGVTVKPDADSDKWQKFVSDTKADYYSRLDIQLRSITRAASLLGQERRGELQTVMRVTPIEKWSRVIRRQYGEELAVRETLVVSKSQVQEEMKSIYGVATLEKAGKVESAEHFRSQVSNIQQRVEFLDGQAKATKNIAVLKKIEAEQKDLYEESLKLKNEINEETSKAYEEARSEFAKNFPVFQLVKDSYYQIRPQIEKISLDLARYDNPESLIHSMDKITVLLGGKASAESFINNEAENLPTATKVMIDIYREYNDILNKEAAVSEKSDELHQKLYARYGKIIASGDIFDQLALAREAAVKVDTEDMDTIKNISEELIEIRERSKGLREKVIALPQLSTKKVV
jgi:hypothetical protein